MKFNYKGEAAYLLWYKQDLVTASLDTVYAREILCRGFIEATKQPIPMNDLISYLYGDEELLLEVTCQQIYDINQKKYQSSDPSVATWVNIAGLLITSSKLFNKFWENSLSQLTTKQKKMLVLEICEDDISDDVVIQRVAFLKEHNFVVAMDDFGSGHSNLLRLNQAQFDIIKLDLNLLRNVPSDLWTTSFYKEIVDLCSSKGSLIVAEGVETQAQSEFVRWAGIDLIQGFLYSKPESLL